MTTETPTDTDTETDRPQPTTDGLVVVTADEGFDATVERIRTDIEASNASLMTTVDHAENAESADETLPPTTLFVLGNPAAGTPLMQAARSVAIDLPQKLLVWQDDGEVKVAYNDPGYLAERHDIDGQAERLDAIGDLLHRLATGEE